MRILSKYFLIASFFFFLFLLNKFILWSPFLEIVTIKNYKDLLKIFFTISITSPPENFQIKEINNKFYILENIESEKFINFIQKYPPPSNIKYLEEQEKIIELRKFVHSILPINNDKAGTNYEPESSFVILSDNEDKKLHFKICSADTKLFSSYLSYYGIINRIIQLENHIGLETFNKNTNKWEFHDAHYNDSIFYNNEYIGTKKINELLSKNIKFKYEGPIESFNTIIYLPKSNLISSKQLYISRFNMNYFSYDNLSLWKKILITEKSSSFYKDYYD